MLLSRTVICLLLVVPLSVALKAEGSKKAHKSQFKKKGNRKSSSVKSQFPEEGSGNDDNVHFTGLPSTKILTVPPSTVDGDSGSGFGIDDEDYRPDKADWGSGDGSPTGDDDELEGSGAGGTHFLDDKSRKTTASTPHPSSISSSTSSLFPSTEVASTSRAIVVDSSTQTIAIATTSTTTTTTITTTVSATTSQASSSSTRPTAVEEEPEYEDGDEEEEEDPDEDDEEEATTHDHDELDKPVSAHKPVVEEKQGAVDVSQHSSASVPTDEEGTEENILTTTIEDYADQDEAGVVASQTTAVLPSDLPSTLTTTTVRQPVSKVVVHVTTPTAPPTTSYINNVFDQTPRRKNWDIFLKPGVLAAVIGGAVVGLLAAMLLVMFVIHRMRKKDEGSYVLDEPKTPPSYPSYAYQKAPMKEFYA